MFYWQYCYLNRAAWAKFNTIEKEVNLAATLHSFPSTATDGEGGSVAPSALKYEPHGNGQVVSAYGCSVDRCGCLA